MINFKLIVRNLLRNKTHTALNIIGLAIGLACAIAVIVWVKYEFSYDKHLPDAARTYRLTFETHQSGNTLHFARCWESWVWEMPGTFPQIEEMVRLAPYRHTAIKVEENKIYSDRVFATDTNFFKIFGINLLSGEIDRVLKEPNSAVISSSLARKFFGDTDPVGKIIMVSGEQDTMMAPFSVKGVMQDTPVNSHIHFDIVTSFANPREAPPWAYVYVLLRKNTSPEDIIAGMPSFIESVVEDPTRITFTPHLQKITKIHLYSNKDREIESNGNISSIYIFTVVAFVLLLISWVNFFNLNKTRLLSVRKQLHIQSITGANNKNIILQSFAESGMIVISSLILAALFIDLSVNPAHAIFGFNLLPNGYNYLGNNWFIITCLLVVSLVAGTLPILMYVTNGRNKLSGISDKMRETSTGRSSYGLLMTAQFSLSVILLISALTIFRQNEFMFSKSLGNMNSDILVFRNQNWEVRSRYTVFRDRAMQSSLIESFTASMEEPSGETLDALKIDSPGIKDKTDEKRLYVLSVEDNFLDFFNISFIAGRNFSPFNPNRKGEDYILNETAVKSLGWTNEEAIGQPFTIDFFSPDIFYGGTVVGVVKDFNFTTVKQKIKPYALFQKPIFYLCYLVKIDPARQDEAISYLKNIWEEELPDYPFQYEFIGDLYKSAYSKEILQAKITGFFSILAILIICFGLYSVTSLLVAKRTKEIGIRKVNGAKIIGVILLLNKGFIRWVAIACLIGFPVAWYAMHIWLQNFVYRSEIKWWVFAVAGVLVFSVTLITVSLQCWRAATRNPVDALRYE